MTKYKSHDILNCHRSEKNTHQDIQDITLVSPSVYMSVTTKNVEKILEITYNKLLQDVPSIAFHMEYMTSNTGAKTAIVIFEKPFAKTLSDSISFCETILKNHTRYSMLKLNAVVVKPTDNSLCGIVNPEISIQSCTLTIHGNTVEWTNCVNINERGQVVPVLYHVTSADRWGVIIKNLAHIYPSTFSNYYEDFLVRYPQTDIEINESNFNMYIIFIFFICFVYMVIAYHI